MSSSSQHEILYGYSVSHAAPIVFAVLIGISLVLHIYQNIHYRSWRLTFFMVWGGTVFTAGWVARSIASYHPTSRNLYIIQEVFTVAGPPLYAAAEYNVLGRLMMYLPMHAPMHPGRVRVLFIYLGATVESLTAAGASLYAGASGPDKWTTFHTGSTLVAVALLLQAAIELAFFCTVMTLHRRCTRSLKLPSKLTALFVMLYGTSSLVLLRCLFRAIQAFSIIDLPECSAFCRALELQEWYLYAFEAGPMLLYTYWLNIVHPGRLLPENRNTYLDPDGATERLGPGWIDTRSKAESWLDPFDSRGRATGHAHFEPFWLEPERWPSCRVLRRVEGRRARGWRLLYT